MKKAFPFVLSLILLVSVSVPAVLFAQNFTSSLVNPVPAEAASIIETSKALTKRDFRKQDFSGSYIGKRFQYTADHSSILRTYTYKFDLVQMGDAISGTSTITSSDGDFGVIKLHGSVKDGKMFFEEYEIVQQQMKSNMVWCFKVGELELGKTNEGQTILYGPTQSYTSTYYMPCTGGFTMLEKMEYNQQPSVTYKTDDSQELVQIAQDNTYQLNVYPNPFAASSMVQFTIEKESHVNIQLFDVNGKLIKSLANTKYNAGTHQLNINGGGLQSGVYILRIDVDGDAQSMQLVKSAY